MSNLVEMTIDTSSPKGNSPTKGVWLTGKQLRQLRVIAVLLLLWPVTFVGTFCWYLHAETSSLMTHWIFEGSHSGFDKQLLYVKELGIDEAMRLYGFKSVEDLQLKITKDAENVETASKKVIEGTRRFQVGFFWVCGTFFILFITTIAYLFSQVMWRTDVGLKLGSIPTGQPTVT